mmetsp:Transcript_10183/g.16658  ORF Transcript_10183/g.16658 Transcript_10183/m.16658 type:complete len:301 (+) Transcript_10183:347-1249(+)|eukprot:CAMPEP_0203743730 /NCGR_PEP_ID=MMETSP0098-20131031/45_1 /ASSEMBLY_ACC=CAM_ASM_000208 /TAXON_ID=96639 /ORGANISM=" , Strain NY0313808BC1" /LENGTH=300 /DNA_ID=CAMNT_0050631055 /DNA_START=971 /DNA_END=1873 /DNA_ORIENTATION=-
MLDVDNWRSYSGFEKVIAALDDPKRPHVLILGEPGAGKTTLLRKYFDFDSNSEGGAAHQPVKQVCAWDSLTRSKLPGGESFADAFKDIDGTLVVEDIDAMFRGETPQGASIFLEQLTQSTPRIIATSNRLNFPDMQKLAKNDFIGRVVVVGYPNHSERTEILKKLFHIDSNRKELPAGTYEVVANATEGFLPTDFCFLYHNINMIAVKEMMSANRFVQVSNKSWLSCNACEKCTEDGLECISCRAVKKTRSEIEELFGSDCSFSYAPARVVEPGEFLAEIEQYTLHKPEIETIVSSFSQA